MTKYVLEFRLYSSVLNCNEETLKDDFYWGLKDNVKDVMMNQDYDQDRVTLQQMMDRATNIDAKLQARENERKASGKLNEKTTEKLVVWTSGNGGDNISTKEIRFT